MISIITIRSIGALLLLGTLSGCTPRPQATVATPAEIRAEITASKSPLLLVHAWATWCDPCRDEFPELIRVHQTFKKQGFELLLVSADDPSGMESVDQFLIEQNCPIGTLVSSELNEAFIETLSPEWGGSLPASFFYADGKLLKEWEGKRTYEEYAETISTLLENSNHETR